MKNLFVFFIGLLLLCCFSGKALAQKNQDGKQKKQEPLKMEHSPELQALLDKAVGETISSFLPKVVKNENVAATLIDLRDPQNLRTAHYNGDVRLYTASVVKMFYMAALHRWLEDGKVKLTPELERGLKDMIVDSSNDATHYILDVLTDAPNGSELSPKELEKFAYKRNAVNRYFQSLGYENINVNQKTYCEDIYGRERQFWDKGKYRNMLTTNATARLLAEIALGKSVTPERSQKMLDLMKRDFTAETKDPDNQAQGFTGIALNKLKLTNAKLWSKAGWTSKSRHDAAYVETPEGLKFVLVVFTENNSNERGIIPGIAEKVINGLK